MSEEFTPYSSPIPIAGTSYSAQIGKNAAEQWEFRVIKAGRVIESDVFDELNGNAMVAFVMRATAIPMLNPYKISQNIKMLLTQADRGPLKLAPPPAPAAAGSSRASEYDIPPPSGASSAPGVGPSSVSAPQAAPGTGCPKCNSAIDPGWLLCPYCGQKLKQMNCPGCSKEINYSFKLCPYCGLTLK